MQKFKNTKHHPSDAYRENGVAAIAPPVQFVLRRSAAQFARKEQVQRFLFGVDPFLGQTAHVHASPPFVFGDGELAGGPFLVAGPIHGLEQVENLFVVDFHVGAGDRKLRLHAHAHLANRLERMKARHVKKQSIN